MYAYTTYIFLYTKHLKNTKLLRKIVCTPLQNVHSTSVKLSYLKTLLPARDSWEEGCLLCLQAFPTLSPAQAVWCAKALGQQAWRTRAPELTK